METIKKCEITKKEGKLIAEVSIVTFRETDFKAKRLDANQIGYYLKTKGHNVINGTGPVLTNYDNKTEGTFVYDLVEEKKQSKKKPIDQKTLKESEKSNDYLEASYSQSNKKKNKKNKS